MSAQRRSRKRSRNPSRPAQTVDIWRAVPEPDEPDPIVPADDPTALIRSLGRPPLPGQQAIADHYLAAVVERAAHLATALAAAGDLLATDDPEESGAS